MLLASAAWLALGIDWGLPTAVSWEWDEVAPTLVQPWKLRYPPLHRDLLDAFAAAGAWIAPATFASPGAARHELWLLARFTSLAFTLGTLWMLWRIGVRLFGRRSGWLPPALYLLATEVPFYAKLANLEAPYLFWFAASVACWLRARDEGRPRDFAGFAVCGAAALSTKDQAFALYVLPALWLLVERHPHRRRFDDEASRARAASDWRRAVAAAAVTLVAAIALVYRLPWGWEAFTAHLHEITHGASRPYRMVEASVAGQWRLLRHAADHLQFQLQPVGGVIAAAALAIAGFGRRWRGRLLPIALFAVSYYLFFIAVVGYHRTRFLLPIVLVAALFAPVVGVALARVARPAFTHAALLVAVLSAALPVQLELLHRMRHDVRYDIEELLRAPAFARGRQLAIGSGHVLPRWPAERSPAPALARELCAELEGYDWLVLSPLQATWRATQNRVLYPRIAAGLAGFDRIARFERAHDDAIDFRTNISAMERLSAPVDLFRRRSSICAEDPLAWYSAVVQGGDEREMARFLRALESPLWAALPGRDETEGLLGVLGVRHDGRPRPGRSVVVVARRSGDREPRLRIAADGPGTSLPAELTLRGWRSGATTVRLAAEGWLVLPMSASRRAATWEIDAGSARWRVVGGRDRSLAAGAAGIEAREGPEVGDDADR